jgi:hypothetical protein
VGQVDLEGTEPSRIHKRTKNQDHRPGPQAHGSPERIQRNCRCHRWRDFGSVAGGSAAMIDRRALLRRMAAEPLPELDVILWTDIV